jgi:hypothetical protein
MQMGFEFRIIPKKFYKIEPGTAPAVKNEILWKENFLRRMLVRLFFVSRRCLKIARAFKEIFCAIFEKMCVRVCVCV